MTETALGWWVVPIAVLGGALRVSTPFLFVSLGECITERSGRINLGLEGNLVMGAMCAYGTSYLTGSPWLGVLAAGASGALLGLLHASICGLPRVNDIAVGIALMLLGGINASGGLLQRRLGLPDASVLVLQGMIFVSVLASETLYGRFRIFRRDAS